MSKEPPVSETTKKVNSIFDEVIKVQKNCEGKMKEIQLIIQGLKHLRQGTAQNILGEKLSEKEVNDLITKIETKIKSLS